MRLDKRGLCVSYCFLVPFLILSQTPFQQDIGAVKSGVVVERVLEHSEAENAGIQLGDILLRWARSDVHGEISSPFDLSATDIEQAPLGIVTLEGLHGTERKTWTMGPDIWGIQVRPAFSESLLAIYSEGRELANAGKRAQAEDRWRTVNTQEQGTPPPWLHPWVFLHIAEMHAEARQWKESDAAYQQAVETATTAGAEVRAYLLRAWAKTYQQRSDWTNAENYYQQSIAESKKLNAESLIVAANREDLGTVSRLRGDPLKADEYYRQALEIRQKLAPGSLEVARSFNTLGIQARRSGDLNKAEEYFRLALEIRQKLAPGSLAVAASFNNLSSVTRQRGDLEEAEEYCQQALEIKQKLAPRSLDVADALNNQGIIVWLRGDIARAEEYWRQGLEIRERLASGSLDVASSLSNLGLTTDQRGNRAKAEKYYRQALEIQQRLAPGSLDVAYSLNNLGELAQERHDLAKAEAYYRQALEIKQKLASGSLDVASSLNNLGELARERGYLTKAEEYCWQALQIRQKLAPGSLDVADSLNNLGEVAFKEGDLGKAEEYYRQGLDIRQRLSPRGLDVADSLDNLAKVALKEADLARAEEDYRRASAMRSELAPRSTEQAESLASLAGVVQRKGELDSAAQLYEQALNALEGQTAQLGAGEEVRADFRAQHEQYYRDYVDLLVAQNEPALAFQVLERSRARTLLETLPAANVDTHRGADSHLLEKERLLQAEIKAKSNRRIRLLSEKGNGARIKAVEKEISTLTAEYQDIEAQIRSSSPAYAALTQPQTLNAKEVQEKLLDSDTLLLEYSLGEKRSHVFVLSAHRLEVFDLASRGMIEQESQRVYDLLTERNRWRKDETYDAKAARIARAERAYPTAVAQLSKTILRPVARRLTGKRLLIVGDGALHYVPFAALPVSLPRKTLAPLAAEHEIIILPSASALAVLRREQVARQPGSKTVAVLADPVFDAGDTRVRVGSAAQRGDDTPRLAGGPERISGATLEGQEAAEHPVSVADLTRSAADLGWRRTRRGEVYFPRLPFSRQEAKQIAAATGAGQSFVALDFKASRATVIGANLRDYRIVHFATHALLNNKHPELSGLVLSLVDERGEPQNGFLDLQDIYNLNLRADLVVLSACETGLGKQISGEDLIGLTRGFMYAGANRVVASLWKIDDRATAELMGHFYVALLGRGMTPAAALRLAQLRMRKTTRWSSPYFWAAFQIQGEWK